jgi:hypothetical protein
VRPFPLGLVVAVLCLFDAAATQCEFVLAGIKCEANPIGVSMILSGWTWVWTWKIAAAVALLCAISALLQTVWGKCLVYGVAAIYSVITVMHLVVFCVQ